MTECYYYKRENEKAAECYELSKKFIENENILKKIELEVSKSIILDIPNNDKEKIFLEAYKYYKENSLLYNLAQVCYYLADFYSNNDYMDNTKKYLDECLNICSLNGYDSFLIREYRFDKTLLENYIKGNGQTYIQQIKNKS